MSYNALYEVESIDKEIEDAFQKIETNVNDFQNGTNVRISDNSIQKQIDWTSSRVIALRIELGQLDDLDTGRKYRKKIREYKKNKKNMFTCQNIFFIPKKIKKIKI